jgi:hypothetical protein
VPLLLQLGLYYLWAWQGLPPFPRFLGQWAWLDIRGKLGQPRLGVQGEGLLFYYYYYYSMATTCLYAGAPIVVFMLENFPHVLLVGGEEFTNMKTTMGAPAYKHVVAIE